MSDPTEDYRFKYSRWKNHLERDDVLPTQHMGEIMAEIKSYDENLLESEQRSYFLNTSLPIFIRVLLDKRYYHYSNPDFTIFSDFFTTALQFALNHLQKENHGAFEVIYRLLSYEKNFYDRHYTPIANPPNYELIALSEKKYQKTTEFYYANNSKTVNVMFGIVLNYFGNVGGFEKIVDYLKTMPGLEILTQTMNMMIYLDDLMPNQPWKTAMKGVYLECVEIVQNFNEEDLRMLQKTDLKSFYISLERILDKRYKDDKKIGKILESCELEIAMKMLQTKNLEKRIHGISEIVSKISQAKNLDEDNEKRMKGYYVYKSEYRETAKWLTSEILLGWIDSKDLIGLVFGPTSHHQIIKRSTDLVKFMYTHGRFTQDHLKNLWEVAFSKHEADREALLSLIQELIPSLYSEDLQFLFDNITSVPVSSIDSQILQLAKSFTRLNSYYRPQHRKSKSMNSEKVDCPPIKIEEVYDISMPIPMPPPQVASNATSQVPEEVNTFEYTKILHYLWELWQQPAIEAGIGKDIATQAIVLLKDSLYNYYRNERMKFLAMCVVNIKKNSMVLWSCEVLQSIIESYPSVKVSFQGVDSKSGIIKDLDKTHGVIFALYQSLIQFKQEAIAIALKVTGEESTSSSDDESTSESRKRQHEDLFKQIKVSQESSINYVEEVKVRLNFLKYIYSNSTESLTTDHIEVLWNCFVLNASSETECDNLFSWLTSSTIAWPNRSMLSDELQVFIFTNLLLKLHPSTFSLAGFNCFERFFINVNKQYHLVGNYGSDENLEVFDIQLISIEALWEIMLEARNELVFVASSNLMKRIYRGLKTCSMEIQEDFIKTCMGYIGSSAPAIVADELSVNKISRCLILVTDFIQEFENTSNKIDIGYEIQLSVKNQCKNMDVPRDFVVQLASTMTWKQAKEIIAERIGSNQKLEFLLRGSFIDKKQDHRTIEELGIDSNVKLIVNEDHNDDIEMMNIEGIPPPIDVQASLESLKMIFEYLSDDLLLLALEKSENQVEEAVTLLTDDSNLEKLQQQLEKTIVQKLPVEVYRLSNILTNTKENFTLLFELFSFGNLRMNSQIWLLLSKIPVNEQIYSDMKNLEFSGDWNTLLDSRCIFKLLYSLQIVNSIITSAECEDWKNRFLELGGLSHVYSILTNFKAYGINPRNHFDAKVLDYLLRIVSIYMHYVSEETIDHSALINCVIDIIEPAIESLEETESVMENALGFLLIIVTCKPMLLLEIYSRQVFRNLISNCLLKCPQAGIRQAITTTVSTLVRALTVVPDGLQTPLDFFWEIIVANFPIDNSPICEEFFVLAGNLVLQVPDIPAEFLERCINFIYSRTSIENRHLGNQDKVLTGYLGMTALLLYKQPQENTRALLEYLYSALFDLEVEMKSTECPPKFKHPMTRRAAFEVMIMLCMNCKSNADSLLDKLYIHHSNQKAAGSFDTDIKPRSISGFVGLRNFGSTCYMNSLIQQIYMMEPIRNGILETKLSSEEDIEDNLLYQMQSVMGNLLESEKEYYEPSGFCQAFKGYDGQSINVRVQQDADEFLSLLFDKLEELLKSMGNPGLLRGHIGGTLVHEIASCEAEFPYTTQRKEQFFRISLDVKNKKSLQEALDLYIKDDMLDGDNKYFCDVFNQKITARMRCMINTLENTVIIHLKRFEFDFSTMLRSKINDYCEFPININFRNWAITEDRSEQYYEYELVGVLLHSGVADSGHYTSIIKDRKQQKWFKFDDRYVESYSIENLKSDCFGGETVYNWGAGSQTFAQTKNAYMLIYERKNPIEVQIEIDTEKVGISTVEQIKQKIRSENTDFLRDLLYFDQGYFDLLKNFIQKFEFIPVTEYRLELSNTSDMKEIIMLTEYIREDESRAGVTRDELQSSEAYQKIKTSLDNEPEFEDQGLKLIRLGTLFAYEMLVRAKNLEAFKYWIKTLLVFYLNHIQASIWFLNYLLQNKEILSEILLECRDPEIRSEFSSFVSSILVFCCGKESEILLDKVELVNLNVLPYQRFVGYNCFSLYFYRYRAVSSRFIEHYLTDFLSDFKRNCRRIDDYIYVLKQFANCGDKEKMILISSGAIQELLNNINDSDKINSDQETEEIYNLLESLICSAQTYAIRESKSFPPNSRPSEIYLDPSIENYLNDYRIKRNLINSYKIPSVEHIILHLCWENIKFSIDFLEEFSTSLINNKFDNTKVSGYLRILEKILKINDELKTRRINNFLEITSIRHSYSLPSRQTFFEQIQKCKDSHSSFVMALIVWWSDLMREPFILESTRYHSAQFRWIVMESFNRYTSFMIYDYLNKGSNFEHEFNDAIKKFRIELDSESEESVEIELDRFRYHEANPELFKGDGEGESTGSENA